MLLIISAVNTASKFFRVIGDVTDAIDVGDHFQVQQSASNNGIYTATAVVYTSGYTQLTVTESIPSSTLDGVISLGVYDLNFSQSSIAGKSTLIIPPYGTNIATSLKFNGKATLNYGEWQQENLLHVLENFAADSAPATPTIGQHWYDNTNKVTKTFVDGSWSTNVNVETGVVSFKDPQHPTPNTKYFFGAAETGGLVGSGVTFYPAINPSAGNTMLRVCDSAGGVLFGVQYNGKTTTSNTVEVTASGVSTFVGAVSLNTSTSGTTGLTVAKNVVVSNGDVMLDTGKALRLTGGGSIVLTNTVTIRGTSTTAGMVVQSTGGVAVATFGDAAITFVPATTIPTLTSTTFVTSTASVTSIATIATANITTLNVTGTSTLAATTATSLGVTGTSTLAATTATSLGVTGTATIATANITNATIVTAGITGTATIATANVTTLGVTGTSALAATTATSLGVTGTATIATANITTLSTATGTITDTPSVPDSITNKSYVDSLVNTANNSSAQNALFIWMGI